MGAQVKMVGEPKQTGRLARIVVVENIADIDVDGADDGAGRFQLRIAGNVRGTRLLYASMFAVGKLRGECRGNDGKDRQREQTVDEP